jgi:hypothetical protein
VTWEANLSVSFVGSLIVQSTGDCPEWKRCGMMLDFGGIISLAGRLPDAKPDEKKRRYGKRVGGNTVIGGDLFQTQILARGQLEGIMELALEVDF